jgi:hypothetical protein
MAWFLRAIELPDGSWACRWSHTQLDSHPTLEEALSHLREFATTLGPAEFFVHQLDGQVTKLGDSDGST